jgi:pimeloyl-ACP methyl ester carboxylesterase
MLAQDFETWVYARRGYQPSGPAKTPKSYADDVADLSAVLEAAGGAAHVVGASYGATVVMHALLRALPGLRSVVVFEPALYAAGPALEPVLTEYNQLLERGDTSGAARLFAEKVARIPIPLLDELGPIEADPDELEGCRHDLEAMTADSTDLARWSAISDPLLLLSGDSTWDPMPATMRALAAVIPGLQHSVLAGQSHFATHAAPQQFADAVLSYLRTS